MICAAILAAIVPLWLAVRVLKQLLAQAMFVWCLQAGVFWKVEPVKLKPDHAALAIFLAITIGLVCCEVMVLPR